MELKDQLKSYLAERHMMQLATAASNQPWCCTVYYVIDNELNLYWCSLPSRRHSKEIESNNKVSAAIAIKFEVGQKVVGVQVEGQATMLEKRQEIYPIAKDYADKFKRDAKWVNDIASGQTDHRFYKLTPTKYVLFDEEKSPDNPRQELYI